MQLNSINANLTNDAMERAQRWDAGASDLEIISAGNAVVVLARGDVAVDVFSALHPLVRGAAPASPATQEPPPQKTVKVTTGLRSAGVEGCRPRSSV